MPPTNDTPCPCGSHKPFQACCGRFIHGNAPALTAEQLMRSRYTAYTLGDENYLRRTWHPSTLPERLELNSTPAPKWLGLKILRTAAGEPGDTQGVVEFVARYRVGGNKAERLHEVSRFVKENGDWLYLDGRMTADI